MLKARDVPNWTRMWAKKLTLEDAVFGDGPQGVGYYQIESMIFDPVDEMVLLGCEGGTVMVVSVHFEVAIPIR